MVRVGGGWMALDEFLVKNDPCRGQPLMIPYCILFYFMHFLLNTCIIIADISTVSELLELNSFRAKYRKYC